MKPLLIAALCLTCFACGRNNTDCNSGCGCVKAESNSSDWEITTKVKSEIMSEPSLSTSARFVSVSTKNGVVTLTGSISSREDRDKIVRIAKNVRGVSRVDNQITISD